jgi:hypothetical protein
MSRKYGDIRGLLSDAGNKGSWDAGTLEDYLQTYEINVHEPWAHLKERNPREGKDERR